MSFKLGKKPAVRRLGVPALGDFQDIAKSWPAVKPRGWEYAINPITLDVLANDTVGDCVVAAMMHYAQVETANTDNPLTPTADLALQVYSAITGYDSSQTDENGNNPTDQGTDYQTQALPYWKSTGIPLLDKNGNTVIHKIIGWASLDVSSIAQQRYACDVFGGTLMGFNCPQSAMDDTSNWTYDQNSPIIGGHGVNRVGQGAAGWHLNSWGLLIPGTWEFSLKLADEDYIVVTPFWLNSQGTSPSGLDINGLLTAMQTL